MTDDDIYPTCIIAQGAHWETLRDKNHDTRQLFTLIMILSDVAIFVLVNKCKSLDSPFAMWKDKT